MKAFTLYRTISLLFLGALPFTQAFAGECGFPHKTDSSISLQARIRDCNQMKKLGTATIALVTSVGGKEVWEQTQPAGLIWSDTLDRRTDFGSTQEGWTWNELMEEIPQNERSWFPGTAYRERKIGPRGQGRTLCEAASKLDALGGLEGLAWRLPTAAEFAQIGRPDQRYFNEKAGTAIRGLDIWKILPNMAEDFFYWSSSPFGRDVAWGFSGYFGGSVDGRPYVDYFPVRCVARR